MAPPPPKRQSFAARGARDGLHPLAAYLYRLMAIKQTNLCVSADVNSTSALLRLAEEVGDAICVLKTHADIVDDFGERTVRGLVEISKRKHFVIFEDRKFGDIGSTVEQQYVRGPLQIANWAHLVNAHLLPGPGIVAALRQGAHKAEARLASSVSTEIFVGTPEVSEDDADDATEPPATARPAATQLPASSATPPPPLPPPKRRSSKQGSDDKAVRATTIIYQSSVGGPAPSGANAHEQALRELGDPPIRRGLLLLAQMSSAGNRMDGDYTAACVDAAQQSPNFVVGYIAQRDLNEGEDNFISFTPGVNLPPEGAEEGSRKTGDGRGQQYRTPAEVVGKHGCDVIIVGRGVIKAKSPASEAERYRREAWKAYEARLAR